MAKRTKTAKTKERKLNLPGFGAEASLGPAQSRYGGTVLAGRGGARYKRFALLRGRRPWRALWPR